MLFFIKTNDKEKIAFYKKEVKLGHKRKICNGVFTDDKIKPLSIIFKENIQIILYKLFFVDKQDEFVNIKDDISFENIEETNFSNIGEEKFFISDFSAIFGIIDNTFFIRTKRGFEKEMYGIKIISNKYTKTQVGNLENIEGYLYKTNNEQSLLDCFSGPKEFNEIINENKGKILKFYNEKIDKEKFKEYSKNRRIVFTKFKNEILQQSEEIKKSSTQNSIQKIELVDKFKEVYSNMIFEEELEESTGEKDYKKILINNISLINKLGKDYGDYLKADELKEMINKKTNNIYVNFILLENFLFKKKELFKKRMSEDELIKFYILIKKGLFRLKDFDLTKEEKKKISITYQYILENDGGDELLGNLLTTCLPFLEEDISTKDSIIIFKTILDVFLNSYNKKIIALDENKINILKEVKEWNFENILLLYLQ